MELPVEMTRYLRWASVVVFGALLAVIERRWIGRPGLGLPLFAGIGGGLVVMQVSPFSLGGGRSGNMTSVLSVAGTALVTMMPTGGSSSSPANSLSHLAIKPPRE